MEPVFSSLLLKQCYNKQVAAKNLKKAMLKKMWNQNGQPRPPDVDGIKFLIMMARPQNITVACHYNFTTGRQK